MSEGFLRTTELVLFVILLCHLCWVPLPFASVVESSQVALVVFPIFTALVAMVLARIRLQLGQAATVSPVFGAWTVSAVLFILVVGIQILPMPPAVVRMLSPAAGLIWDGAGEAARVIGIDNVFTSYRFSIAPDKSVLHLLRLFAYLGAFLTASAVVRESWQRTVLALVLGASALFQVLYGLNEWYAGTDSIWGWRNVKIYDRVSGTFVNPNHFAHYLGIVFPVLIFLAVSRWKRRARFRGSLAERITAFIERDFLSVGTALAIAIACLGGVLVAQSRGALLAILLGTMLTIGLTRSPRSRHGSSESEPRWWRRLRRKLPGVWLKRVELPSVLRAGGVGVILALIVLALVLYIGVDRTVARFLPTSEETVTLVGRTKGIEAALGVWKRFPLIGSGLGTFDDVVLMAQDPALDKIYTHAHNDYLEIAATTGILGLLAGVGGLFAGSAILIARIRREGASRRRSDRYYFRLGAATSLAIALVHAALDFNFFIPANPVTLAVIVGAAVSIRFEKNTPDDPDSDRPDYDPD